MSEIPDVVTGEVVASEWGNQIRDRTLQRYADEAERDTQAPTPSQGDMAYIEASGEVQVFNGSRWTMGDGGVLTGPLFVEAAVDISYDTVTATRPLTVNRSTGVGARGARVQVGNVAPTQGYALFAQIVDGAVNTTFGVGDGEVKLTGTTGSAKLILEREGSASQWRFAIGASSDLLLQSSPDGSTWTTVETWNPAP